MQLRYIKKCHHLLTKVQSSSSLACQYKGFFFSYCDGYIMVHSNPTIEKKQYMHALCKYDDQGVFVEIEQISQDDDDFDDYNLMRNYDVITAELVFKIPRIVRGS